MANQKTIRSSTRKRLHRQGYGHCPDAQLQQYKYGIRFAYLGCGSIVVLGFVMQSPIYWLVAMIVAFLAVVMPRHPFDYLYNYGLRHLINKPAIPTRSMANKFACGLATVWIGGTILLFNSGAVILANIIIMPLIIQAFVVGTIDFCVPSLIYNALFLKKSGTSVNI